jgi:hypothetical protein
MILILPRWLSVLQKPQYSSPPNLIAGGLHQKGTPSARTYKRVNFSNQIIRQQDVRSMCALVAHIFNVTPDWEFLASDVGFDDPAMSNLN